MELIRLDAVRRFLAEATDLNELLDVKRKVEAASLYAKRTGLHEAQNDLAEAKLRIDRRIGQVLAELPREKGGRPSKNSCQRDTSLQSAGIKPKTVHRLQTAASVPEETFEQYVTKSRESGEEITQAGVLKLAQKAKRHEPVKPPAMPKGTFDVLYADPPWRYDFSKDSADEIEQHYPTMETDEIAALKVPAAPNAVLFLWATAPKLREALQVMEAWGFEYRTHAIWDKEHIGTGYWFRGQHELLLVGARGTISPPEPQKRKPSVFRERRTKHSKKPEGFYSVIEEMMPGRSYCELFARQKRDGWEAWGSQA